MSLKSREKFEKHLDLVCKDEKLRAFIMQYFLNLGDYYKNTVFTKDNFETIIVDGEEIAQDIVLDLFSKQKTATAQEVFAYLFMHNVDSVGVTLFRSIYGNEGLFSPIKKSVKITRQRGIKPKQCYYKPEEGKPADFSNSQWRDYKKSQKDNFNEWVKDKLKIYKENKDREKYKCYKEVLDHELTHIFELRTFKNRSLFKTDMTDAVYNINGRNSAVYGDKITQDLIEKTIKLRTYAMNHGDDYIYNPECFLLIIKDRGAKFISEVMNEVLRKQISDCHNFVHRSFRGEGAFQKAELTTESFYNINYDVVRLLEFALANSDISAIDYRFNSKKVVDAVNRLPIDKDVCDLLQANIATRDVYGEISKLNKELRALLKEESLYNLLCYGVGNSQDYVYENNPNNYIKCKIMLQTALLSAIKNNITNEIDKTEAIGPEMIKEWDSVLKEIDGLLYYPSTTRVLNEGTKYERLSTDIEDMPLSVYSKTYPKVKNIALFNAIYERLKSIPEFAQNSEFVKDQEIKEIKYLTKSSTEESEATVYEDYSFVKRVSSDNKKAIIEEPAK